MKLLNKTIIIPIVFLLIGVGSVLAYNQGTKWLNQQRANALNIGRIQTINQIYEQALVGKLPISNFLLDENGKLIKENGRLKRGEQIILIKK